MFWIGTTKVYCDMSGKGVQSELPMLTSQNKYLRLNYYNGKFQWAFVKLNDPTYSAMTIEYWFWAKGARSYNRGNDIATLSYATHYSKQQGKCTCDNELLLRGGKSGGATYMDTYSSNWGTQTSKSKNKNSFNWQKDKWQHIALTWDSKTNTIRHYKDGVMDKNEHKSSRYSRKIVGDGNLVLFHDQDSYNGGFDKNHGNDGGMDELRIWNTARTPEEIKANYNKVFSKATAPKSLKHQWSFNGDLKDSIGSAHMTARPDFSYDFKFAEFTDVNKIIQ